MLFMRVVLQDAGMSTLVNGLDQYFARCVIQYLTVTLYYRVLSDEGENKDGGCPMLLLVR